MHHLYNGGSNTYLSHEHLEDRVNASKDLSLKEQIVLSTSKNESSYKLICESNFCRRFYKDLKIFKPPFSCVPIKKKRCLLKHATLSELPVRHF